MNRASSCAVVRKYSPILPFLVSGGGEQIEDDQDQRRADDRRDVQPGPDRHPAIPMAAVAQMVAAVVSPEMLRPLRKMVPAPKNPTPVTIWAATLDWSAVSNPKAEIIVNSAEPTATIDNVRSPAGLSALRRS